MGKAKYVAIARVLFGIIYLINGLNYTFHFFAIPDPHGLASEFHHIVVITGMFQIAKLVEVVTGLALLLNVYVPLALVVALPVTIVVAFVDLILVREFWAAGAGGSVLALNVGLMFAYLQYYRPMLARKAAP